jgi:hypothetical protein
MPKKRTPTKPQNPRKIAPKPESWPAYAHDDIDYSWAREAIRYGNAEILARYLWQADEIDPRVRRELAEMLDSNSNHTWRLDVRYRFRGKPTKLAKHWKSVFNEAIVNLTKLLSGVDPLDPRSTRGLSDMLDPDSDHELQLDFTQRKRGRPPLALPQKYYPGLVSPPIETDPTLLLARRAVRIRGAKGSGPKVLHKQIHDENNRSSYFAACSFSRSQVKRPIGQRPDHQNNEACRSNSMYY